MRSIFLSPSAVGQYLNHTIDSTNNADGKPILFEYNNDTVVFQNKDLTVYGQIIIAGSNNTLIDNCNISGQGLSLMETGNATIINNNITIGTDYIDGIRSASSVGNNISNNVITVLSSSGSSNGINLDSGSSSNTYVENNNITSYGGWSYGIRIYGSDGNMIRGNNILTSASAAKGIHLSAGADNNLIDNNNVLIQGNAYALEINNDFFENIINNSNFTVTAAGSSLTEGVYIQTDKTNTSIYNSIINSQNDYDIYVGNDQDAGSFLKLYNVTWNESDAVILDTDFILYNYNYLIYQNI